MYVLIRYGISCILLSMLVGCGNRRPIGMQPQPFDEQSLSRNALREFPVNGLALGDMESNTSRKSAKGSHRIASKRKRDPLAVLEQRQARLPDIPFLLGAKPIKMYGQFDQPAGSILLGYMSMLSMGEVVQFYVHEMERYGWHMLSKLNGMPEVVLVFTKPDAVAVISLRAVTTTRGAIKKGITVVLQVGNKDQD